MTRRVVDSAALARFPRAHVSFEGLASVEAAVRLSSFMAVPAVLAHSDAWAMLPLPFAREMEQRGQLAWFRAPHGLPHPSMQMQLLWPAAQDAAPGSRWLRALIVDVVAEHHRAGPPLEPRRATCAPASEAPTQWSARAAPPSSSRATGGAPRTPRPAHEVALTPETPGRGGRRSRG